MRKLLGRYLTAGLVAATALTPKAQKPVATPPKGDDRVYVGILDDAREDFSAEKTRAIKRRIIMPAFEERDAEWQAIAHFGPRSMKWIVAFDGNNLGDVESHASVKKQTR